MKDSILSIILLALIISLTVIVGSANLTTALAIENYLQLRSANVEYHGGDIDVDIRTGGNIPSESGNNGFGYAVLTDVGDESVDNVLVAISDVGIKNNDKSTTKNDKLHTYVLDLTGDTSKACSGSDYEVTKSSSDNEGFDTSFPIDVEGNKISIDDVDRNDLASGTVKAIASFTAEAITNNGKIKQICIDIQDVLKQSEISVGYSSNNNDDHDNDDDKDKSRHKDENKKNNDDKKGKDHDDDSKKVDDDDSLFETDIDQSIEQSNECSGSSTCSNEGSNEVDVFESENSGNNDGFDFDSNLDIDQSIEQNNECNGEASCSNEANNEVDIGGSGSSDNSFIDGTDLDVDQFIDQSNACNSEADCSNKGGNEANLWEDTSGNSDIGISQSIEQSNTCGGSATCSNIASNVANIG